MYEKYKEDPHAQKWSSIVGARNKIIARQKEAIRDRKARIIGLEGTISTLSTPCSRIKERICQKEVGDIERPTGRDLLKGKTILVIGPCACKPKELLGFAKLYGFTENDITFISDYSKIKNRGIKIWNNRVTAIIVGPVPHNVKEIDVDLLRFITDYQDTIPVIVCKNGKGHLKITKQAFKAALFKVIETTFDY